jgi:hypothetical protein
MPYEAVSMRFMACSFPKKAASYGVGDLGKSSSPNASDAVTIEMLWNFLRLNKS